MKDYETKRLVLDRRAEPFVANTLVFNHRSELRIPAPDGIIPTANNCPHASPGDLLYLGETYQFNPHTETYIHKACHPQIKFGWQQSQHMPPEAARIWLKVKTITIQTLEQVNRFDAHNEGFHTSGRFLRRSDIPDALRHGIQHRDALKAFHAYCEQLGWPRNCQFWVLGIQRISKHHAQTMCGIHNELTNTRQRKPNPSRDNQPLYY